MTEGPDPSRKTTVRFSIVYLVKAYLGPGCLGLPYAMKQAGLALGLGMLLAMCALALCNTRALVRCKQRLTAAGTGAFPHAAGRVRVADVPTRREGSSGRHEMEPGREAGHDGK